MRKLLEINIKRKHKPKKKYSNQKFVTNHLKFITKFKQTVNDDLSFLSEYKKKINQQADSISPRLALLQWIIYDSRFKKYKIKIKLLFKLNFIYLKWNYYLKQNRKKRY